MRASHILVKHQGSRRTASWKDVDGVDIKERTKVCKTTYSKLYSIVRAAWLHVLSRIYGGNALRRDNSWFSTTTESRTTPAVNTRYMLINTLFVICLKFMIRGIVAGRTYLGFVFVWVLFFLMVCSARVYRSRLNPLLVVVNLWIYITGGVPPRRQQFRLG